MINFLKNCWFWLENSRVFTLPMSIFAWLVIFVYSYLHGGNIFYGVLALIGICLGQLATNLFDDYVDFKVLTKKGTLLNQTKSKCCYIIDGRATLNDVLRVVFVYCFIALCIGLYLFIKTGFPVVMYAFLGGIFILTYAKWSNSGLGELAVGIVFGPILFGGVYWVMVQSFSFEVFVLSFIHVMFTVGLLYTNALLDFDGDLASKKTTLCQKFGNKKDAIKGFYIFYGIGYLLLILYILFTKQSLFYYLPLVTIPLAFDLIKSMSLYNFNKNKIPVKRFWHKPFEYWENIKNSDIASFRFRMFQARNLQIYFSILLVISMILDKCLIK